MQQSGLMNGIHYCFIVDEPGMASVFPLLKLRLTEEPKNHVSLTYVSVNNQFVFNNELRLLEKIFCLQLMVCYESTWPDARISQTMIEAVINANVMEQMWFIISGSPDFVSHAKSILIFLGIENIAIKEQFFI